MRIQKQGPAAIAVTVALAAVLVGCGGGGDEGKATASPSVKTSASSGSEKSTPASPGESTQVLAQMKGEKGITVTVNEASRDSGGFVTVKGAITNNGADSFNATNWIGQELAVAKSGASVAGAVLVDAVGKKRYYVLRDTDGICLCTTKLIGIRPEETRPFFAQFPAPPEGTTEVEFQLPTMPPAKITISEG
ncbi:hypothetical protein [Actinacidiphila sp. bgisy160]|uniref:hypothetical protein n=1 Tax=Actinacidiphila sp. bgisy160 TaxID=3413796 RepID=UPI003D760FFB